MRTHRSAFLLRTIAFMWVTSLPGILDGPSFIHAAAPPVGIKPTATITGEVKIVLLNHHGEIDGFLLADGTRVKFPPHIGASLAAIAKPGQRVSVIGFTGLRTQFGTAVDGLSVTSAVTGLARSAFITAADLPVPFGGETQLDTHSLRSAELLSRPLAEAVQILEQELIRHALARCHGNKAEAARLLGITRQLLYTKLKELGME